MSIINNYSMTNLNQQKLRADLNQTNKSHRTSKTSLPLPTATNSPQLMSYKASNLSDDAMNEKIVNLAKKDAKTNHMWSKDALQLYHDYVAIAAPDRFSLIRNAILGGQVDGNTIHVNGKLVARYDPCFGWQGVYTPAEEGCSYDFGAKYGDAYKAEVARLKQEQIGISDTKTPSQKLSIKV